MAAGSAVVGRLRVLLSMDTADFEKASVQVSRASDRWSKSLGTMGRQATNAGMALTKFVTLPLAGLGAASLKAGLDFESAFAGVGKTVDGVMTAGGELTDFGRDLALQFRQLAKEIPLSVTELARVGEAAGQLGIQKDKLIGFTAVMAKLGATTNLSSDQAATSLARLANITGLSQDQFDRMGSAIVGLGNNFATTESEIVEFATRIAGAGTIAGLTEAQILGIGTAMSSVGVQAEAGGTSVQKVLNGMTEAVATGNDSLRVFAETAGLSAQQFADAYRDNAGETFTAFVEGLGTQGDRAFKTLNDLGLGNERVIRSFLSLANAGDLTREALARASTEWEKNTALTEEAQKRFATTRDQLTLLWNRIKDVGITIFTALKPAIDSAVTAAGLLLPFVEKLAQAFSDLPGPVQLALVGMAGLAAATGPVLYGFGLLARSASDIASLFGKKGIATRALGAAYQFATAQANLFSVAMRGLGVASGVAATAFAGWKIGRWIGEVTGATNAIQRLTEKLFNLRDASVPLEQQQRIVNQAIALGADRAMSYADALAFLQERGNRLRAQHQQTAEATTETAEATDALVVSSEAAAQSFETMTTRTKAAADEMTRLIDQLTGRSAQAEANLLASALRAMGGAANLTAFEAKKLSEQIGGLVQQGVQLDPVLKGLYQSFLVTSFNARVGTDGIRAISDAIRGSGTAIELTIPKWVVFDQQFQGMVETRIPQFVQAVRNASGVVDAELGRIPPSVTEKFQLMIDGVTGKLTEWGSTLGELIATNLGGPVGTSMGAIASSLLSGLSGIFSGGISTLLQSALPLAIAGLKKLGSLIMSGLKSIWNGITGIFKGEGSKTNDMRDDWMDAMGGFEGSRDVLAGMSPEAIAAFERAYYASDRETFTQAREEFDTRRAAESSGFTMPGLGSRGDMPTEIPSFETGTNGRYVDFADGTLAMLHGKEKVTPMGGNGSDQAVFQLTIGDREFGRVLAPILIGEVQRLQLSR